MSQFDLYSPMIQQQLIEDASRCVFRLAGKYNSVYLTRNSILSTVSTFVPTPEPIYVDRLNLLKSKMNYFVPNFSDSETIHNFLYPFKTYKYYQRLSILDILGFSTYAASHLENWDKTYERLQEHSSDQIIPDIIWNEFIGESYLTYLNNLKRIPPMVINSFSQSILRECVAKLKNCMYDPTQSIYEDLFTETPPPPPIPMFFEYEIADLLSRYQYDSLRSLEINKDIESYLNIRSTLFTDFSVDLSTTLLADYSGRYINQAFTEQLTTMYFNETPRLTVDDILLGLTELDKSNIKSIKKVLDVFINAVHNSIVDASMTNDTKMFLSFYPGSL
jgi:hypothetical protein